MQASGTQERRGPLSKVKVRLVGSTFAKHTLTLISGTAVAQLLQLVAMIFVGRLFTVAEMAVYTLVMTVVSAVVPIAAGRYELAVVLPKRDDDARQLIRLCTWINTAVSAVVVLLTVTLREPIAQLIMGTRAGTQDDIHAWQVAPWLLMAGPLVWLVTQLAIMSYWLTRTSKFGQVSENRIHQAVSVSVLQIGTGLAKVGVVGLLVATIAGYAAALVNLYRKTRQNYRFEGTPRKKRELAKEYIKMPLLNGPNAIVDSIRINGINLLIPSHFGGESLGQFGMAWRVLQAPMALINAAVSQVFFPQLARVRRGEMLGTIKRAIWRSVLIGIVPFGLIWWLAPWMFPLVFGGGDKWAPAGQISRALVPWLYLNFITSPISTVFVVVKRQFILFVYAVAFMIVPLWIIINFHDNLLTTMHYISWSMAGMLCIFLVLALWVSSQFDKESADEDDDQVSERNSEAKSE